MSSLPYIKVVWKENGERVTRKVPTNWIQEDQAGKEYVCWPNKVNATKDVINRTQPGKLWRMFRVKKKMDYYDDWEDEASTGLTTETDIDGSQSVEAGKRSQRRKREADSCNEDGIEYIRKRLAQEGKSGGRKAENVMPVIPSSFVDARGKSASLPADVQQKTCVDLEDEPNNTALIEDDDTQMKNVGATQLEDQLSGDSDVPSEIDDTDHDETYNPEGDISKSDSDVESPFKKKQMLQDFASFQQVETPKISTVKERKQQSSLDSTPTSRYSGQIESDKVALHSDKEAGNTFQRIPMNSTPYPKGRNPQQRKQRDHSEKPSTSKNLVAGRSLLDRSLQSTTPAKRAHQERSNVAMPSTSRASDFAQSPPAPALHDTSADHPEEDQRSVIEGSSSSRPRALSLDTRNPNLTSIRRPQFAQRANQEMDMATFQWEIFRKVDQMEAKIDGLVTRYDAFMRRERGTSVSDSLRLLPAPLKTKQAVDELEEKVQSNTANRKALVELFSQMGGPTPNKLASHIMNRLMDCTAAQSFNIRGTGNKVSFKDYNLYTMVFEGVKLAFPNARRGVDTKIHSAILENLRASGSKLNRRKERATSVTQRQRMAAARSEARDQEVLHQTGVLEDDTEDEDDYEDEQD